MPDELTEKIAATGFECLGCAKCCSGEDNEVMVSPNEIAALEKASGLCAEDIAEPYPSWIEQNGAKFTFGRVLKRGKDGDCIFLKDKRCSVYEFRPHICRTYPFMLDETELIVSECEGVGCNKVCTEADKIKIDLVLRKNAEDLEFELTKKEYQKHSIVKGSIIIFDSLGAHEIKNTKKQS